MIMSNEPFTKGIISMTFLFGVIEHYAKYFLVYRPDDYDFFDEFYHAEFRKMFIGNAINKLKRTNTGIATSLTKIDKHSINRLNEMGIIEQRWTKSKISDRLCISRNAMVHGESHAFYDKGEYLVMLYILFHFHHLRNNAHTNGLNI